MDLLVRYHSPPEYMNFCCLSLYYTSCNVDHAHLFHDIQAPLFGRTNELFMFPLPFRKVTFYLYVSDRTKKSTVRTHTRLHNIYFLWIVLDLKIRTIYARVNIFPIQSGQIHVSGKQPLAQCANVVHARHDVNVACSSCSASCRQTH